MELLRSKDISAVVNCTDDLQNYHTGSLAYLTFNVAWWRREVGDSEAELPRFLSPLITFLEAELAAGRSVLVHCLAGAHRSELRIINFSINTSLIIFQSRNNGNYVLDAFCRIGKS